MTIMFAGWHAQLRSAVILTLLLTLGGAAQATSSGPVVGTAGRPTTAWIDLRSDGPDAAALRLKVAAGGCVDPATLLFRVFVGLPSADASTPVSDPSYVGSFAMPPETGGLLELSLPLPLSVIARLGRAEATSVTVVAVPIRADGSSDDAVVSISEAVIG
jgi:hypothetical protein